MSRCATQRRLVTLPSALFLNVVERQEPLPRVQVARSFDTGDLALGILDSVEPQVEEQEYVQVAEQDVSHQLKVVVGPSPIGQLLKLPTGGVNPALEVALRVVDDQVQSHLLAGTASEAERGDVACCQPVLDQVEGFDEAVQSHALGPPVGDRGEVDQHRLRVSVSKAPCVTAVLRTRPQLVCHPGRDVLVIAVERSEVGRRRMSIPAVHLRIVSRQ